MCERFGIAQDDPFTPQGRWNRVYGTVFLRPRFVHGAPVIGVQDAFSDTIKETLAWWSSKLSRAELPSRSVEPSQENPYRCAADPNIKCIPVIGTKVGDNIIQDFQ